MSILSKLRDHPMFRTLREVQGNQRTVLYTEALWGVPNALYLPYVSIYMLALGLTDAEVGLITTIFLACQCVTALFAGVLTDKLGRRRFNRIAECLSWSVPTLIWAFSQNFWWFVVAALFNSCTQGCSVSWGCYCVEDAERRHVVNIYNWIYIASQLSVFFVPIATLLVSRYGTVSAMRVLYLFAFVMMTAKWIIFSLGVRETSTGLKRMEETKDQSIFSMLKEYIPVAKRLFSNKLVIITILMMLVIRVSLSVRDAFFSIYVTGYVGVADAAVGYFPMVRAIVMLIFFFTIQAALDKLPLRPPMILGFLIYIASNLVLIVAPANGGFVMPMLAVLLEALGYALVFPRKDALTAMAIDPHERARMMALLNICMIALSAPFGYISGLLSTADRRLPFILLIGFYVLGIIITLCIPKQLGAEKEGGRL